jgi:hypothetical protein
MTTGPVRASAEWLRLREPADAAARASDLVEQVRSYLPTHGRATIHDLGCDQMTAGPAIGTAWLRMKKIPVPIVPPIPIAERPHSPTERLSSLFPVSAPVSSPISRTGLRRNTCSFNDATVPYLSLRMLAGASRRLRVTPTLPCRSFEGRNRPSGTR